MKNEICNAIKNKKLLEFNYDGCYRLIEPHTFGVSSKGKDTLAAYQIDGTSLHGEVPDWKQFTISKIVDMIVLTKTFEKPRPGYKRGDSRMNSIYCEI